MEAGSFREVAALYSDRYKQVPLHKYLQGAHLQAIHYLSGLNFSGSSQLSGLWWIAYTGITMVRSFLKCTPFKMQSSLQVRKVLKEI